MNFKTTTYIFLAVITILIWNSFLIRRDKELFNAYDKVCAELSQSHPNCRYSK
jgi:hypothetical protein